MFFFPFSEKTNAHNLGCWAVVAAGHGLQERRGRQGRGRADRVCRMEPWRFPAAGWERRPEGAGVGNGATPLVAHVWPRALLCCPSTGAMTSTAAHVYVMTYAPIECYVVGSYGPS